MAKRFLTKQQKDRIYAQQQKVLDQTQNIGLVIAHQGKHILVEYQQQLIPCYFKQNLGYIAAGDKVALQKQQGKMTIMAIEERQNLFLRRTPQNTLKSIAANIEQIIITNAVLPSPNTYLIDRYIVAAYELKLPILIIFNKIDLVKNLTNHPIAYYQTLYQNLHFDLLNMSVKHNYNLDQFKQYIYNKKSLLVGLSGVGKSSLIKACIPDIDIKIAEISENSGEGKHTTRTSSLYHLPQGGDLIDVPGIRDFTPHFFQLNSLEKAFPDISLYSQDCQFRDCQHQENNLGCAVQQALKYNKIYPERFHSYQQLQLEYIAYKENAYKEKVYN